MSEEVFQILGPTVKMWSQNPYFEFWSDDLSDISVKTQKELSASSSIYPNIVMDKIQNEMYVQKLTYGMLEFGCKFQLKF